MDDDRQVVKLRQSQLSLEDLHLQFHLRNVRGVENAVKIQPDFTDADRLRQKGAHLFQIPLPMFRNFQRVQSATKFQCRKLFRQIGVKFPIVRIKPADNNAFKVVFAQMRQKLTRTGNSKVIQMAVSIDEHKKRAFGIRNTTTLW